MDSHGLEAPVLMCIGVFVLAMIGSAFFYGFFPIIVLMVTLFALGAIVRAFS